MIAWLDPEVRAAYLADNLFIGTFDQTLVWLIRFEVDWLVGPEVATFIIDTVLAWVVVTFPPGSGTDWWFTSP